MRGMRSPRCMTSRTKASLAPSLPPGWKTRKSRAVKPLPSSSAIASASPSTSCIVVEVVGARPLGHASWVLGGQRRTSASRPSALSPLAVMAINGMAKRLA